MKREQIFGDIRDIIIMGKAMSDDAEITEQTTFESVKMNQADVSNIAIFAANRRFDISIPMDAIKPSDTVGKLVDLVIELMDKGTTIFIV